MNELIRKVTSRKFLMAVAGVVMGAALSLGVESTELVELVSVIGGAVTALFSAIAYINAEAKVDAAALSGTTVIVPEVSADEDACT